MKALAKGRSWWTAALLPFLLPRLASASILLPPWEQEALEAGFIGIVECEVAGDVVAKCKVVESWKGPKTGVRFSLAMCPDDHGHRHPTLLCGQQLLVIAYGAKEHRYGLRATPDPSNLPVSWRDLPADYVMSHRYQHLPLQPPKEGGPYGPLREFAVKHRDLPSLKRDVLRLLRAPATLQEARVMQAHFDDCIQWLYYDDKTKRPRLRGALAALCEKMRQARSAEEVVSLLLSQRLTPSRDWPYVVERTLAGGGPVAFRRVISTPPEAFPGGPSRQSQVLSDLQWRNPGLKPPATAEISPAQEARSLRKLAERCLREDPEAGELPRATRERLDKVRRDVQRLKTPEQIVEQLLETGRESEEATRIVRSILSGGAHRTLRLAESTPPEAFLAGAHYRDYVVLDIRRRLGLPRPEDSQDQLDERLRRRKSPTEAELAGYRKQLRDAQEQYKELHKVAETVGVLTVHDPAVVAAFLLGAPELPDDPVGWGRTYQLASWFGWKCGSNRAQHFRDLLQARSTAVRVAAAVYLCFEDKEAGLAALREMRELPGPPGAWAAATLARQGDKSAVSQALNSCSGRALYEIRYSMGYDLPGRMLVLLSNSAQASKVPQPTKPYLQWWERYRDKLTLQDVWLPLWEKQKLD